MLAIAYIKKTKTIKHLAWAVLLTQFLTLFFCGEPECMLGESEEACKTLLCSTVDRHDDDSMHSHFPQQDFCNCACNFSYHITSPIQFTAVPVEGSMPEAPAVLYASAPLSGIDHIPRS